MNVIDDLTLYVWTIVPKSITELIVFCATLLICLGFAQRVNNGKIPVRKIYPPGLFPWPVVGNAPFLGSEAHKTFHAWAKYYGPIFQVKLGSVKAIVISNMQLAKATFCSQKHTYSGRPIFPTYKYVSRGESIVFNDVQTQGSRWHANKSLIIRHLHKFSTSMKVRKQFNDLIRNEVLCMIEQLQYASTNKPINPEDIIRMTVANSQCVICFGKRFEYDNKEFCELLSMNNEFGAVLAAGTAIDSMPWITIFPKFRKAMEDYLIINKRLDSWAYKRTTECLASYDGNKAATNLVDSITCEFLEKSNCDIQGLKQSQKETISALVEDVFAAGQHSTSSSFFWIVNYLLNYPEVKRKLKDELNKVVGDRLPQLSDKKNLPYMEAFLHEVFRHSSLLSTTIPHMTLNDSELAGYHIPRNTMVILNQYSINRDSNVWKDPENFDPTRFLIKAESESQRINEQLVDKYVIFSLGIRKCPAADSAKMWLFLATSILVHTTEIFPDPNLPPTIDAEYGLVLKPKHLSLSVKKQKT